MTARLDLGKQSIEISIRGYKFPDPAQLNEPPDDHTSNWLDVNISASDGQQTWVEDPASMTTWEIYGLADWLVSLADGSPSDDAFYGTEFYPWFELDPDAATIHIIVQHWIRGEPHRFGDVYFPTDAAALRAFAADLRAEVGPFPVRVALTDGPAARFLARGGS